MDSQEIKVLIIEDDAKKARQIHSALPEYFSSAILKYKEAKEYIASENNRLNVKLVIMCSDEADKRSVDIFKYLCEDPDKYMLRRIPVVLLTNDEFSDFSMQYYELGEPYFFEGELDDSDFYMTVTEALEAGELRDDKDLYPELFVDNEAPKPSKFSVDKIMGASFEVHVSEDAPTRIAAYDNKQIIEKISKIVSKNKEKATQIWDALEKAANEKRALGEEVDYIPRRERKREVIRVIHADENPVKASKSQNIKPEQAPTDKYNMQGMAQGNRPNTIQGSTAQKSVMQNGTMQNSVMQQNMMQGGMRQQAGMMQAGMMQAGMTQPGMMQNGPSNIMKRNVYAQGTINEDPNRKKKILIVDSDTRTLKAFQLFVGDSVDIELCETGMKAIDFFSKKVADMVIVEHDMPGLLGMTILKSIWMQPNGRNVKAAIMMGQDKSESDKAAVSASQGIVGIIDKPIVKKQLLSVVNRVIKR